MEVCLGAPPPTEKKVDDLNGQIPYELAIVQNRKHHPLCQRSVCWMVCWLMRWQVVLCCGVLCCAALCAVRCALCAVRSARAGAGAGAGAGACLLPQQPKTLVPNFALSFLLLFLLNSSGAPHQHTSSTPLTTTISLLSSPDASVMS